jgi:flagellin-like hook-associated protein FlgL
MRIADISSSHSMVNSLTNLKSTQNLLSNELITGKRINNLQDNSSLAQKLLNSQVTREKLIQQNNNITLCDNIASASVDSLKYIDDELDLATTVSESAMSVTASDSDAISAYAGQIDDILNEVLSMANTKYGDDYLFAGDASGASTKPYAYKEPAISEKLTAAIDAAKAATSDGTTFDTNTATAAATIQTQFDEALSSVNAKNADGSFVYGGEFTADSSGNYTFSGTATPETKAICDSLNSIKTLQSTVSSGGSVGDTITKATSASDKMADFGKYVYNGSSGNGREIKVADGVEMSPFADEEGRAAILDTLNSLVDLRNAIASADKDTISAATEKLSIAQDTVVDATSDISTTQSRLSLIANRNAAQYTNLDDAEEAATNVSEEETTVKLLAAQQAYSAALQGTSLLLGQSLLDYL